MQRITRVGILSLGRVAGAWGAVMGLVFGALYAVFFSSLGMLGMVDERAESMPFLFLAGIALFGTPILCGLAYFVLGLVSGVVLNLIFHLSGGLEVRIEK